MNALSELNDAALKSSKITNYRMEGDQLSNAGKNIADVEVITVANINHTDIWILWLPIQWRACSRQFPMMLGKPLAQQAWTLYRSLTAPITGIGNVSAVDIWDVVVDVVSGVTRYIDPTPVWKFILANSVNSSGINSILLLSDVYGWEISAFNGTAWNDYFSDLVLLSFDNNIYDIKFNAVDSSRNDVLHPNHFIHALTFDNGGLFNGKMTLNSPLGESEVPEPSKPSCILPWSCCTDVNTKA